MNNTQVPNTEVHTHAGETCNGKRYLTGNCETGYYFVRCPKTFTSPLAARLTTQQVIEHALSNEPKRRIGLKNSSPEDYRDDCTPASEVRETTEPPQPMCDIKTCLMTAKYLLEFELAAGRQYRRVCRQHLEENSRAAYVWKKHAYENGKDGTISE
ncbi:MAG TPA: hypothetical protein VE957_19735 [Terriglobales bacterium]|nr:hypothetical protein [Terriglobales bacterium]